MNDHHSSKHLIEMVAASTASNFYRTLWGSERSFEHLPFLELSHLLTTPLPERTYTAEKGLTKIVHVPGGMFLTHWGLSDIAAETYHAEGKRPLVLLTNSHDALEKSLWFYERGVLPLIGEAANLSIAAYASARYGIDAIVSDEHSATRFLPELEKEYEISKVRQLILLGASFTKETLRRFAAGIPDTRPVLALPETGALSYACPDALKQGELLFHPNRGVIIECIDERMVITKERLLVTPIVRYRTSIGATTESATCECGSESFRLLPR